MFSDLILVRHGETEYNRNLIIQGWQDVPLNETGHRQAVLTARILRDEVFDEVWASDMKRTLETAEHILEFHPGIPVHPCSGLREWKLGILQGKSLDEIKRTLPEMSETLAREDIDLEIPGGERRSEFQKRVEETFRQIAAVSSGKRILVVTHGGVLARVFRFLHRGPVPQRIRIPGNASVSRIRFDHETGHWAVLEWDKGNLPREITPPAL